MSAVKSALEATTVSLVGRWALRQRLTVAGDPRPQGSKSISPAGALYESSRHVKAWREAIAWQAKIAHLGAAPITEPVLVVATFYMRLPQKPRWRRPAGKPDLDKLQRALGDGLTDGGLIVDDAQIVAWAAEKRYARSSTGVVVEVFTEVVPE